MTSLSLQDILLIVVAAAVVIALVAVMVGTNIARKRRLQKQKQERRYQEAKALARDFINAQIDYTKSVNAFDNATIEAFEAIIAEIAKTRKDHIE